MRVKRLAKLVICYVLAVLATLIVIGLLADSYGDSHAGKAEDLIDRWHISELDNTLLVELPDEDGIKVGVSIIRNESLGTFAAAGIIRDLDAAQNRNIMLGYASDGKYGAPNAFYGSEISGTKIVWRDLNADGRLDIMADYERKLRKINIEGDWVFGRLIPFKGKENIFDTGDSLYRFDPNSGQWAVLDPNDLPRQQAPIMNKKDEHPFEQHDGVEQFRQDTPR